MKDAVYIGDAVYAQRKMILIFDTETTGKADFDGAHDAMADVRACARVYRWLMERAKPNV